MELSFGCVVDMGVRGKTTIISSWNGSHTADGFAGATQEDLERSGYKIIGHPIQLQHWLRVFGEECDITPCMYDPEDDGESILALEVHAYCSRTMYFNLTTGQPATEADYKAFNEIVGV